MINYSSFSSITGKPTGVKGYEYDDISITIYFKNGGAYCYNHETCGEWHVDNMKTLANNQHGLNSYVTKNKPMFIRL